MQPQWVATGPLNEKQSAMASGIRNCTTRAARIITDLGVESAADGTVFTCRLPREMVPMPG